MQLSSQQIQKIAEYLLLNAYTTEKAGFYMGKAGISLTLFELSRFDSKLSSKLFLEDHAVDLLTESLTYEIDDCEFANGTTGIGFTVNYLINNKFIAADYLEIYQNQHIAILNKIERLEFNFTGWYYYTDFLLYIHCLCDLIEFADIVKYQKILTDCILRTLDTFRIIVRVENSSYFYMCATRILSIFSIVKLPVDIVVKTVKKIKEIDDYLSSLDCICNNPLFIVQFYCCSLLYHLNETKAVQKNQLLHVLQNFFFDILDIRQKINLCFSICRISELDSEIDHSVVTERLVYPAAIETNVFEKQVSSIIHYYNSIKMGEHIHLINRWLWLNIYWDKMINRRFSQHVLELFNC